MTNKVKKDEKLSAEQICKILHISKRKCAWMLQNGMIPCKDSGKKTRRYTVLRKDLDAYMKDRTEHPEKYFIPVTFTSNNPGKLYDPDFVTGHFGQLLKKHNLKKIRFHDLRHSCASVLLAQGVPMKQIQEWLGHSDMSTTANIYSHLDAVTKADTGAAMSKALG